VIAGPPLSFVLHCPDSHLTYDGSTPATAGVGGGVTARVLLAEALARAGHQVEVLCNAGSAVVVAGVRYTPLTEAGPRTCDVLVGTSTGGALDVGPVADAGHDARLVLGWVQGFAHVRGYERLQPRALVCCSGFVRDVLERDWGLPASSLAVLHNGVPVRPPAAPVERDPFLLLYTSHPDKGLHAATGVLRHLRAHDPRFRLLVVGGARLWGQQERDLGGGAGVEYLGLLGQEQLGRWYEAASWSMHLQHFQEPFGIALAEARRAGCVPVASDVGAFPEVLQDGRSGLLVSGDPSDGDVLAEAARRILEVHESAGLREHLQRHTPEGVLDWDVIARAWTALCRALAGDADAPRPVAGAPCSVDGGALLPLADGYHCFSCGRRQEDLDRSTAPRA
jgi:glycosyltransferase involved in cell wall biosynthesis